MARGQIKENGKLSHACIVGFVSPQPNYAGTIDMLKPYLRPSKRGRVMYIRLIRGIYMSITPEGKNQPNYHA